MYFIFILFYHLNILFIFCILDETSDELKTLLDLKKKQRKTIKKEK